MNRRIIAFWVVTVAVLVAAGVLVLVWAADSQGHCFIVNHTMYCERTIKKG